MSLSSEQDEITGIVNRMLNNLAATVESKTGSSGASLRQQIGDIRASYMDYLKDNIFTTELLVCFTTARDLKVRLGSMANVRLGLFDETPVGEISNAIVQAGIGFCLSAESKLITDIEFVSRDDVDAMIKTMKSAFDTARELAADAIDSASYQSLTFLAGALTSYLADAARPLPRMVTFHMQTPMPALALSNRIYYTTERWEEVVNENRIVHPAFCPREIRGLAS
jgi:hypothetical protein